MGFVSPTFEVHCDLFVAIQPWGTYLNFLSSTTGFLICIFFQKYLLSIPLVHCSLCLDISVTKRDKCALSLLSLPLPSVFPPLSSSLSPISTLMSAYTLMWKQIDVINKSYSMIVDEPYGIWKRTWSMLRNVGLVVLGGVQVGSIFNYGSQGGFHKVTVE